MICVISRYTLRVFRVLLCAGGAVREFDIKALLISRLRSEGVLTARAVLADEYPVGRTSVRADLAFLADDFVAVEIKSEHDSLRRLPRQLSVYRQFFDRTILVVADRHVAAAQSLDLEGVELWGLANGKLQHLAVYPKAGEKKPLADLLTSTQREKWGDLLEMDEGRDAFIAAFRARFGQTSKRFWEVVGRKRIKPDDLIHLSRFKPLRSDQARLRLARAESWNQWSEIFDVAA